MRVLELYCGIGGVAAALPPDAEIVAAVDQSEPALSVYRHNFLEHPTVAKRVDSLDPDWLKSLDVDLWWASPPCQPFTQRGMRRGLDDPRAQTFKALLRHIDAVRPRTFAIENVEGFQNSDGHDLLRETLEHAGYASVREHLLCPSDFGVVNRRPRFYLVASKDELGDESHEPGPQPSLSELLDAEPSEELWVDDDVLKKYEHAMHIVSVDGKDDTDAVTNCFTSAYGRSHVRSGSYLRTRDGRVRRFSPSEILRLLGFPESFTLPSTLRRQIAWRLVGNSLSLVGVRWVLSSIVQPTGPSAGGGRASAVSPFQGSALRTD